MKDAHNSGSQELISRIADEGSSQLLRCCGGSGRGPIGFAGSLQSFRSRRPAFSPIRAKLRSRRQSSLADDTDRSLLCLNVHWRSSRSADCTFRSVRPCPVPWAGGAGVADWCHSHDTGDGRDWDRTSLVLRWIGRSRGRWSSTGWAAAGETTEMAVFSMRTVSAGLHSPVPSTTAVGRPQLFTAPSPAPRRD